MNRTYRYLLVPCVLGLIGSSAACELIASVDRSDIGSGGSTTSTGDTTTGSTTTGTGGSASTSTSTGIGGASTTSTGTGGTGGGASSSSSSSTGGMVCASASDCPMPPSVCATRVCTAGTCSTMNVLADTPASTQTPGDCKQNVCDGTGDILAVDDDTDIASDNEACTVDTCSGGMASHMPAAAGADCAAQGPAPKRLCGDPNGANAGKCVQCNVTADCTSGKTCVAGACQ